MAYEESDPVCCGYDCCGYAICPGGINVANDAATKSGIGVESNTAPKSRLLEFGVGYRTIPAPGSLSEAFHGANAT
jgi:hypothetical protein